MNAVILIAVMAVCTVLLRALPFLIFNKHCKTPSYILFLGNVLPEAVIGMLVVYCLRDTQFVAPSFGIPEILGTLCVVFLQCWKKNSILSILGGTAVYMALIRLI